MFFGFSQEKVAGEKLLRKQPSLYQQRDILLVRQGTGRKYEEWQATKTSQDKAG